MDGQITFEEFLKNKNKEYSKHCRRCIGDYCYHRKQEISQEFMCPCEEYEERLTCDGCKWNGKGLRHCLENPVCKRYCFSPCVRVSDNTDKWEAKDGKVETIKGN